jgi:hypothetical protein
MTSDSDTTKSKTTPPAAGTPTAAKPKPEGGTPSKPEGGTPSKAEGGAPSKPEGSAPSGYSRGEGQKPVTDAYKENWNRIYGKKKRSKSPRTRQR